MVLLMIIFTFFHNTEYKDVADIIAAQAALETGWFESDAHNIRNNFFSMKSRRYWPEGCRKPICKMRKYRSVREGLEDQLAYYRRHQYPRHKAAFLVHLVREGYAEDPEYIKKVARVARLVRIRVAEIKQVTPEEKKTDSVVILSKVNDDIVRNVDDKEVVKTRVRYIPNTVHIIWAWTPGVQRASTPYKVVTRLNHRGEVLEQLYYYHLIRKTPYYKVLLWLMELIIGFGLTRWGIKRYISYYW